MKVKVFVVISKEEENKTYETTRDLLLAALKENGFDLNHFRIDFDTHDNLVLIGNVEKDKIDSLRSIPGVVSVYEDVQFAPFKP